MNTPTESGYYWAKSPFHKEFEPVLLSTWADGYSTIMVIGNEQETYSFDPEFDQFEWGEKIVRCDCVLPEYVEIPDNPEYHRRQPIDTLP
jgi:hypothetical protein